MQYTTVLQDLGFSKNEIAVYRSLLSLDSGTVTDIAKKADINRTSCYDILASLSSRGLVGKFKKKKKTFFQAGDPRRLNAYLEREKEEFSKQIQKKQRALDAVMPELMSQMEPQSTKPKVTFYEGKKGMREAYEDTLTADDGILAYANVETMHKGLPDFFPEYYKRRADAGIHIKAIMPNNAASKNRAKKDKEEDRESIIFEDTSLTFSPEVNIYNDKTLIASWKEKMAVVIESKEFADLQRLTYKILWDKLKKSSA